MPDTKTRRSIYRRSKTPASATDPRMAREQYEREGGTGRSKDSHVRMGRVVKSPKGRK